MSKPEDSNESGISKEKVDPNSLSSLLMCMQEENMSALPMKETNSEIETNNTDDSLNLRKRKAAVESESKEKNDEVDIHFAKKRLYSLCKIASSRMDSYIARMNQIQNIFNSLDDKVNIVNEMLKESTNPSIVGFKNVGMDNKTIIVPAPQALNNKEMKDYSVHQESLNGTETSFVNSPVPTGQYGQVLKLNNEGDYPAGSWLGDPKKTDLRVRCHITPRNLLYVEQENKTPEKMALALLDYLFDKETQALSNISGQGKHGKKMLNPLFIYGIQCHLTYKFGIDSQTWRRIKQSLDSKCRTAFNRKHKGLPLTSKNVHSNESNSDQKCQNQLVQEDVSYLIENGDLIETNQGYLRVLQLDSDQIAKLNQSSQIVINETDSIISYVADAETGPCNVTIIDESTYIVKEKDL